jgi:hypothetical protein
MILSQETNSTLASLSEICTPSMSKRIGECVQDVHGVSPAIAANLVGLLNELSKSIVEKGRSTEVSISMACAWGCCEFEDAGLLGNLNGHAFDVLDALVPTKSESTPGRR